MVQPAAADRNALHELGYKIFAICTYMPHLFIKVLKCNERTLSLQIDFIDMPDFYVSMKFGFC